MMNNKLDVFNDYWDWVWDAHFANKDKGVEVKQFGAGGQIIARTKRDDTDPTRAVAVVSGGIGFDRWVEMSTRDGDITRTVTVKVSRKDLEEWLEQRKG